MKRNPVKRLIVTTAACLIASGVSAAPALAAQKSANCDFSRGTSTCVEVTPLYTYDRELKVGGMQSCYVIVPTTVYGLDYSAHHGAPNSNGKALADPYEDTTTEGSTGAVRAYCTDPHERIDLAPQG